MTLTMHLSREFFEVNVRAELSSNNAWRNIDRRKGRVGLGIVPYTQWWFRQNSMALIKAGVDN